MGDVNLVNATWRLIAATKDGETSEVLKVGDIEIQIVDHPVDKNAIVSIKKDSQKAQTYELKIGDSIDEETFSLHHQSNREIF